MADRPRFFDDLAGVAGGAFSALSGISDEVSALARARVDEVMSRLALVRREEFDAVSEMASRARLGQADAEAKLLALESRVAVLEQALHETTGQAPATPNPHGAPSAAHDPHAAEGAPGAPPPL